MVAEVSPSTASVHLNRLKADGLIKVHAQGKHRYFSLEGINVGNALEALSVLAGGSREIFKPNTPSELQFARTCYDHIGVMIHDRFKTTGWILEGADGDRKGYDLSPDGEKAIEALGIDLSESRSMRRRFAYPCLDWSERQPHIGGALGAALLRTALDRRWVDQHLDSRALTVTSHGKREMNARFGLRF